MFYGNSWSRNKIIAYHRSHIRWQIIWSALLKALLDSLLVHCNAFALAVVNAEIIGAGCLVDFLPRDFFAAQPNMFAYILIPRFQSKRSALGYKKVLKHADLPNHSYPLRTPRRIGWSYPYPCYVALVFLAVLHSPFSVRNLWLLKSPNSSCTRRKLVDLLIYIWQITAKHTLAKYR